MGELGNLPLSERAGDITPKNIVNAKLPADVTPKGEKGRVG